MRDEDEDEYDEEEEWEGEGLEPLGLPRNALSLGFLASAPLFLFYELGQLSTAAHGRNVAELVLGQVLRPLGAYEDVARWLILAAAALFAWGHLREESPRTLARTGLRIVLEGLAAAFLMGPILLLGMDLLDVSALQIQAPLSRTLESGPQASPTLVSAARLTGGAVWEEVFFRVGCYGLIFLFVARVLQFFGVARNPSRWMAEALSLSGSSVFFAAFHLDLFTRWLGAGGELYDPLVFLWRLLAGALLALIVRWRGLGVGAWAHAIFNLALVLGAIPGSLDG